MASTPPQRGADSTRQKAAGTTSTTQTTTTQRATTTTRWIDGTTDGKMPWGWPKVAALAGLPALALFGAGTMAWGIPHVEDHRTAEAVRHLAEAGITDVDVDFDWRGADLTGELPPGKTPADAVAALEDKWGVRDVDVSGLTEAPAPAPPPPPPPPVTEAPAPETGIVDVVATSDGETITLTGEVLDDAQRTTLVDAAADAVGADNVVDELTVSGLAEGITGSDDRVAGLAGALSAMGPGIISGTATLSGEDLNVNAEVADDAAKDGLDAILASVDDVANVSGTITAPAPPETTVAPAEPAELTLDEEVEALQSELDALQQEISETVVFASADATLTDEAKATLDKVVAAMQRYQLPVVEVEGHTDSQGDDAYNQNLSQLRSDSVREYLESQGIDLSRLQSNGYGEDRPVADNETEDGRQQNRRVQFTARPTF